PCSHDGAALRARAAAICRRAQTFSVAQTRPAKLRAAANCRSPHAPLRYVQGPISVNRVESTNRATLRAPAEVAERSAWAGKSFFAGIAQALLASSRGCQPEHE